MINLTIKEIRSNLNKFVVVVFVMFIVFGLLINYSGINKTRELEQKKKNFIENEIAKVGSYDAYSYYAVNGYKLLFVPDSISAMFYSTTLSDKDSVSNTNFRLDINDSQKSKNLFKGNVDLAWYLITIGSIAALIIGWFAFRNRKRLKYLLNQHKKFTVYISMMFARIIMLISALFILNVCILGQFYICGIHFDSIMITNTFLHISIFGIVMVIFMTAGAMLGYIRDTLKGVAVAAATWFVILILLPNFLASTFSERADSDLKSSCRIERESVKITNLFEKMRKDYVNSKEDKVKATKEFLDRFLKEGKLKKLELELINEIEKIANDLYLWSTLNPVSFYKAFYGELSGKGYNEHIKFHRKNVELKEGFIKFIFDGLTRPGKVKPYLTGDEYIYYAKPSLPAYFGLGLLVQLFWIVLLFVAGYILFSRSIYPKPKNKEALKDMKIIDIPAGKTIAVFSDDDNEDVADMVYNVLSGKCEKNFIKVNGVEPAGDFFYLPPRSHIPVDSLPDTELKAIEYAAERSKTIVLDGFIKSYKCDEVNEKIKQLKKQGYVFVLLDIQQQVNNIELCFFISVSVENKTYQIEQMGHEHLELKDE